MTILPENQSAVFGTGEYGSAGRTFPNAKNIKVNNPQGVIDGWTKTGGVFHPKKGDFHNSHNRVADWINGTIKE